MIKPTIGRVVLVYRPGKSDQWEPAQISYVWSDTCINVGGFDKNGIPFRETSLHLDQEIEVDPVNLPKFEAEEALEPFACWMPYQKAQAAKNPIPSPASA
jgi:hypothetical protein